MNPPALSGFIVLYRWRIHPHREAQFVSAWSRLSARLRDERGSLGSRLHRGADGLWYSYAQWPSAAARQQAFALAPVDPDASEQMQDAIEESFPELVLSPVADFLAALPDAAVSSA